MAPHKGLVYPSEKEKDSSYNTSTSSPIPPMYDDEAESSSHWQHFVDGFKRDPQNAPTARAAISGAGHVFDVEAAARATAESPLARKLRGRHLQMIAIGGSIGTGLFVSSGGALSTGGPASLLIAFGLIGLMLYCTVHALGEMAVLFPVAGSFSAYSTRFLDPAWGFAMGWNYAMQWLVTLPLEIVAATLTISFWNPSINNDAFVIIFLVLIISINFFGVRGYGEAEFIFAVIKVVAMVGFIILGSILNIGGGPHGSYIGGKYWRDPGAFHNGFKGTCSVFVTAAFAFGGTELVGLAAAETANPRRTLPTAVKQVFWRIFLFYLVSLMLVGLLVPYTDKRLLNATGNNSKYSPFVIAIQDAGIAVLPSVMNAVIMIAVLSVGNASIFGSSRTLAALAEQGQAPRILAYVDRRGRPLVSISVASSLGFLAFLGGSKYQVEAFNWMLAISGLSSIFTWGSICLAHIRFRKAWRVQGHILSELAFTSQAGLAGSWIGFIFNVLVLIAQFWTGFAPVGYEKMTAAQRTMSWFAAYLAAPVVIFFYIPYKLYFKTSILRSKDMDLKTGRREVNLQALLEDERAEKLQWPTWKKVYKWFC